MNWFKKYSFNISEEKPWFHVSDQKNLKLNPYYNPRQGQMGKGLYVTQYPDIWADGILGNRPFVYKILGAKIAQPSERPNQKELTNWGIKNGYLERGVIKRPDGSVVLGLDNKPLIGLIETDKFEEIKWQDPMTGIDNHGLEHEYLKSKGYNGVEALYSPDGQQAVIFSFDNIKIYPYEEY
jgi:hypothetical protein